MGLIGQAGARLARPQETKGSDKSILVTRHESGVTVITLNRPTQMNALSLSMHQELGRTLKRLRYDKKTRVVVLKGNGEAFSSGGDLNEWYREWYTKSPDLVSHAFKLLLRLSALRFLLAGHPSIEQAPEPCAVEIFQIFTKQVERDFQLMPLLDQTLTPESLGVDALGRTVLFAKACG